MNDDWSKIKPLNETEALLIISNYLKQHGYEPFRINTDLLNEGEKSPDFQVLKNSKTIFLCEVKTPGHILNESTRMYHWDTTFNKLRRFIHTASKQFNSFDNEHIHPRVAAFTSNHPQLNWTSFQHNILGAVKIHDKIIKDYRSKTFVIETNKDINDIDVFLWLQVNRFNQHIYELAIYSNQNSKNIDKVDNIVNSLVPYKEENISTPNYSAI